MKSVKPSTFIASLICLIGFSLAAISYAGISADVTIKDFNVDKKGHHRDQTALGKYYDQDKKIAVEYQYKPVPPAKAAAKKNEKDAKAAPPVREPVKQTIIVDSTTGKMTSAPPKKQFVEFDLNMPRSWEQGFWVQSMRLGAIRANEDEFRKRNYDLKAVKVRPLNGHSCQVWSAKRPGKTGDEEIEIWEAKDLDNVPLKITVKQDGIKVHEFSLANVKKTQIDVAVFAPPADYTKHEIKVMTGGMPAGAKKGPGMRGAPGASKAENARKL